MTSCGKELSSDLKKLLFICTNRTMATKRLATWLMLSKNIVAKIAQNWKESGKDGEAYINDYVDHTNWPQGLFIISEDSRKLAADVANEVKSVCHECFHYNNQIFSEQNSLTWLTTS